jgi:cobalt-zinc-cadmium resistance protein CzcA
MEQIRDTLLSANNGSPVRIGDVAKVTVGHQPRLGIAGQSSAAGHTGWGEISARC